MKSDNDRERVHQLLDGELDEGERQELLGRIAADPEEQKAYESLLAPVAWLEKAGGLKPPQPFTRQVMGRLKHGRTAPSPAARFRDFLFRGRSLRWNMATALAAAAVLILTTAIAVRQIPRQDTRDAALTVKLNFYAPQAQRVAVAGDFNRWQTDTHTLVRRDGGIWTVEIPLRPGVYSYMFVVDGTRWVSDPDAEAFQDDGFGNRNAVVRVSI